MSLRGQSLELDDGNPVRRSRDPPGHSGPDRIYQDQMYSASSRRSADLGLAPTICLTTCPPENTFMVGMAMMPYRCDTAGFSSMLSLTTAILSAYSVAISSSTGATMRHGPHHSAQ